MFVTVAYPDNTVKTVECALTGGCYVATFDGCPVCGKVENGLTISADGIDEKGNAVTGYALGKGDIDIMDARDRISPGKTLYYVRLFDDEPDAPKKGDMYKKDGNYVVWQNGQENPLGVRRQEMENYVDQFFSSNLPFALVEKVVSGSTGTGTGTGTVTLTDHAINTIVGDNYPASIRLVFPSAVAGRSRDFQMLIRNEYVPNIVFPQNVTIRYGCNGRYGHKNGGMRFVEYVETYGAQYVDTRVVGKVGTRSELKFAHSMNGNFPVLLGSFLNDGSDRRFHLVGFWGESIRFQYGSIFTQEGYGYVPYSGGIYVTQTEYASNGTLYGKTIKQDGSSESNTVSYKSSQGLIDTGTSMYLFADHFRNSNIDQPQDYFCGKLYGCKIWQDGFLVRDFKPCKIGLTGALYDTVSESVFYSSGASLIAGYADCAGTLYKFKEIQPNIFLVDIGEIGYNGA